MPTGVLMFIPNYHILHDFYNLHSEVTYHLLLAIYVIIILSGILSMKTLPQHSRNFHDYLILFYLAVYYLIFFGKFGMLIISLISKTNEQFSQTQFSDNFSYF